MNTYLISSVLVGQIWSRLLDSGFADLYARDEEWATQVPRVSEGGVMR